MKHFSPFRLDTANQCLWRGDTRISLRPKAFAVLAYLVQHAGRLVTQDEFLRALWPGTFVQPDVLKTHVLEIRAALGDDPKHPTFIETLPRRGYRFIKTVKDTLDQPSLADASKAHIVGRERELEKLRSYLSKASAGERQIVFVTGEAGIGKTTLVDTFTRAAKEHDSAIRITRGQCVEGYGVQEPYYPVLVALGTLLREKKELVRVLEIHAPTWLAQFPGLLKPEHRQTLQREIQGATRQRMVRELCDVLPLISAEETLLLVLEDIHWGDPATVDLIAALAYHRTPARLLLIATYRSSDAALSNNPLNNVKQDLAVHELCHELEMSPLTEVEIAQYLAARSHGHGVPRGLAGLMHRFCEGNPLFLRAALDHLLARGHLSCSGDGWSVHVPLADIEMEVPDNLRKMLELQVERLSEDQRHALQVASVCGVVFFPKIVAAAGDFDLDTCEQICHDLARQFHILRPAGSKALPDGAPTPRYQFLHAFYRQTIYDRLPSQRRSRLHLRIGQSLEDLYSAAPGKLAAELALHFEAGCDWKKAAKYLQLVAGNKGQRFAYREAAPDLEHALELLAKLPADESEKSQTEVMLKLGAIYFALDNSSRSLSFARTVAERAALRRDSLTEINVLMQMGIILGRTSATETMEVVNRLFAVGNREQDPGLQARAHMGALSLRLTAAAPKEEDASQFRAELARAGSQAGQASGYALFQLFLSQYQDSARNMEENLPILIEAGDIRHRAALLYFILALVFSGNWGKALRVAQDAIATARKNENYNRENVLRLYLAATHLFAHDWAGALELCEDALPILNDPYDAMFFRQGLIFAGTALVGLGRYELAAHYLGQAREQMDAQPVALEWYWRMPLQSALTDLALRRGDLQQAQIEAQRFRETSLATAERTWQALAWEAGARVALAGSDVQEGRNCIRKAIAALQGFDLPLASWRVHGTAMQLFPEAAEAHRGLAASGILRLAESLQGFPSLRESFLTSELARSIGLTAENVAR